MPCVVQGSRANLKLVKVDRYGDEASSNVIVYLNGSGGANSHADWIHSLALQGALVLVPHYLDATAGTETSDRNYADWAQAVFLEIKNEKASLPADTQIGLMGYSLGASVALVLSTQCSVAQRVVSWEGSLPDFYYMHLRTMPHLLIMHGEEDSIIPIVNASQLATLCVRLDAECELKRFKGQGHIYTPAKVQEAEAAAIRFLQSK